MLKQLEEKGLIRRSTSELDSRKKIITLEEKGLELQRMSASVRTEIEKELCSALDEEELAEFRRLCIKLIHHLEGDMHENCQNFDEFN